ncbi:glycoside hydrolase family 3 N-terminal domain-containing protein [Anaerocolumna xylanovorans]|uniref:beta-N-acetylhexosaminidase n=1 Tax=Anaerocolumna xylanovorans DSM 12503 TaxID=1121345 RepID=A0A1M7Y110_9FIRM|nr:glycoside hydrolase family 3 N-terminal domain-containing protein [Anaerocolumna xylanovorans]SHO45417.1 beta-N-acetylhexosaminidase [Anaerocolumna xylanovorans DSM 12503]
MIDLKAKPFYLSDEDIKWVEEAKASLSLDEKIGQLFFPIGYSPNEQYLQYEILNRNPGGLMFRTGKSEELFFAYSYLQEHAKIPMLLSANLEAGGDGIVEEGTAFGKQMQAAATSDPEQAYRLGKISCSEAQAVGCNYAFAPVVDIDMNYHNPITNVRTYGANPEMVKQCGLAYMRGAKECGSAVSIKHFPGDGVDEVDQHILTSVNSLSCEEWDRTFGDIYQTLIDAEALTVMAGHIALPAYQKKFNPASPDKLIPASLSPELLQNLLREKMGFNGMIITDATPMAGFLCAMDREKSVPYCIEAGCDMILFNKDYEEDLGFMKKGYETGILSEKRLEDAVTRILAAKAALKLHIKRKEGTLIPKKENLSLIGCEEHKKWAKECAEKSVTLVKDTQKLLPISPEKQKRVLFEIMGSCPSEERVAKRFIERMEQEGFEMIPYQKEVFDFSKPMHFETVTEFRNKYDLVIFIGNVENASNKTTNRLNWHAPYGAGNNIPWFVEIVPTMFISLQNPYHLLDVPMIKTYINAYSNHDMMIDTVVEKIIGKSPFVGKSPIDPFCGKEYLTY